MKGVGDVWYPPTSEGTAQGWTGRGPEGSTAHSRRVLPPSHSSSTTPGPSTRGEVPSTRVWGQGRSWGGTSDGPRSRLAIGPNGGHRGRDLVTRRSLKGRWKRLGRGPSRHTTHCALTAPDEPSTRTYTHTFPRTRVHTHVYTSTHTRTHPHTNTRGHTHVHTTTHTTTHTYTQVHTNAYTWAELSVRVGDPLWSEVRRATGGH